MNNEIIQALVSELEPDLNVLEFEFFNGCNIRLRCENTETGEILIYTLELIYKGMAAKREGFSITE